MLAMLSTAVELMSSDYIKWTCVPMIIIKIIAADPIHEKRMQKIKAAGIDARIKESRGAMRWVTFPLPGDHISYPDVENCPSFKVIRREYLIDDSNITCICIVCDLIPSHDYAE